MPATGTLEVLDGDGLLAWAKLAVAELVARRAEINALNVFPVPDSDTGSNMAHTMESALAKAQELATDKPEARTDAAAIAAALAAGAVRGARGNSGVVLSQVLRGIAQAADGGVLTGASITTSLSLALSFVNRAITDPVEGTVITVLRAASIAAVQTESEDLSTVVEAAASAAQIALANTPSQLAALREAGVVDAGGKGFVILLEALLQVTSGDEKADEVRPVRQASESTATDGGAGHGHGGYLEVMFSIDGVALDAVRDALAPLGDSLVIAHMDNTSGTVHIHSHDAGAVIETAYRLGAVSGLRIEVLPDAKAADVLNPKRVVVAITPPGTLAQLYGQAGALVVTRGPHPARDTDIVYEVVSQARSSGASEVILLPNGLVDRVELASIERSSLAFEQSITIVPAGMLVCGLAALSVHDPMQPLALDTLAMVEATTNMRTAVLQRAEKARLTQAGACAKNDILAKSNGEIIAVADNELEALAAACTRMLDVGGEQITLLIRDELADSITYDAVEDALHKRGLNRHRQVDVAIYPADNLESLVEIGVE